MVEFVSCTVKTTPPPPPQKKPQKNKNKKIHFNPFFALSGRALYNILFKNLVNVHICVEGKK